MHAEQDLNRSKIGSGPEAGYQRPYLGGKTSRGMMAMTLCHWEKWQEGPVTEPIMLLL